jgi:hypothetical protein
MVKGSGRDEPVWVVIHMCMKTKKGISLFSYLHAKLAKIQCFSFYHVCFFLNKSEEKEGRTCSALR